MAQTGSGGREQRAERENGNNACRRQYVESCFERKYSARFD